MCVKQQAEIGLKWHQPADKVPLLEMCYTDMYTGWNTVTVSRLKRETQQGVLLPPRVQTREWKKASILNNTVNILTAGTHDIKTANLLIKPQSFPLEAYLAHQTVRVWRVMDPLSWAGWDRDLWCGGCCLPPRRIAACCWSRRIGRHTPPPLPLWPAGNGSDTVPTNRGKSSC